MQPNLLVTGNINTATNSTTSATVVPGLVVTGIVAAGGKGDQGAPGLGLPAGGTAGQVLVKNSSTNYDTAWGAASGGGAGTVTAVSVTTANGISGTVANPSTTPAISLSLGAITPTSVASTGAVTGSNLSGTNTGDETLTTIKTKLGITTLSGSNTGDQTNVTGTAGNITGTLAVAQGGSGATVVTGTGSNVLSTSPALTGTPTAPTPTSTDNSTTLATTAFVTTAILNAASTYDDVKEAANLASFPATGLTGTIYVADDTGFIYRWSGSAYIQVGGGTPADATTTSNGIIRLAGDLAGTAASPTVPGLANKAAISGQVFTGAISATNLSGTNTGDQTTITGNAGTATTLQTARTIGTLTGDVTSAGSTFNGSANNTNATTVTKINGTSLAGLATGILKNTTATGVPSIAVAADFPTLNQNTTGTAASITGNITESQVTNLPADLAAKQATLVSGTNIKTINSTSLLGSGDIAISGSVSAATPTANGSVKQTQYNVRDYSAVGDGTTDDTTAIQNAINAAATAGGGVVIFPLGTFLTGTLTLKDTVSLMGTSFNSILKLKASAGTLIISENFATAAGSGNSFSGIKRLFIRDLTFNGNSASQTDSAASDYRGRNAILKLYAWNYSFYNVHINDAKEIGLYTEHDNDWNGENFNETTFGESTFEQIYIKNYGQVGWVHRGPHDSHVKSVYVSSYNASGLTAVYGVVAQTNGTSHYGSQGLIADNLHVWGEHSQNAVLLDGTNIVQGKIYAEGSTLSAVKIQNSTKNYFHLFAGYATNAVEIASTNDNTIEVTVESNISASAFLLTGTSAGNDCRHITGISTGPLFNMTTYTGGNNVFRSGRPYNATLFGSTAPATTDRVDVISDNYPDSGRITRWELPIAATKVKFTSAGLDLGGLPITNTSTTLGGSGSGITRSVSVNSGNVTLGAAALTDYYAICTGSSTYTTTLPSAVSNTNIYHIKNGSTAAQTIATTSSQTIDGSTTVSLTVNTALELISDGANWRAI